MIGRSASDASSPYFKSLTTSMTLDRRPNAKRNSGVSFPKGSSVSPVTATPNIATPFSSINVSEATSDILQSNEKAKKSSKLSRIALLSSLFEKKVSSEKELLEEKPKTKKQTFLKKFTSGYKILHVLIQHPHLEFFVIRITKFFQL